MIVKACKRHHPDTTKTKKPSQEKIVKANKRKREAKGTTAEDAIEIE